MPPIVDLEHALPIVVGAQPEAELFDRPVAYRLRDAVVRWQREICDSAIVDPIVLSDVYYLNHLDLRERPTICIGHPRVNAFSAYLVDKLPTAFGIDDRLMIQLEDGYEGLDALVWGAEPDQLIEAMDAFLDRFLDEYLRRVSAVTESDLDLIG
ncbi:MAG: hypothetical protein ACF8PN_10810 [Phycisphaerales bacterium]